MVFEMAQIKIRAGDEAAFERAAAEAVGLFGAANGCHGMRVDKSIEHPGLYFLIVEWETVEHHMVEFRNSPAFPRWRELVGKYFDGSPSVQHTTTVVGG
jgi:heme-degrading monooxygenase HmoA